MTSSSGTLPDEICLMRMQLDALLVGQGRLETALASIVDSRLPRDMEEAGRHSQRRTFCSEAAHGAAGTEHLPVEGEERNACDEAAACEGLPQKPKLTVDEMIKNSTKQAESNYRRRKMRFENIIEASHKLENEEVNRLEAEQIRRSQSLAKRVATLSKKDFETYLDTLCVLLIMANTIFIGMSLDHNRGGWNAWQAVDLLVSLIFFLEFLLKVYLHRGFGHFLGPDKCSNIFDSVIIMLDVAHLIVIVVKSSSGEEFDSRQMQYVSLLRVGRIMRILRVLRLLKVVHAKTLVDMLQGLLGGLGTLGWAVVLLALMVYITAVLGRVFFGSESDADITEVYPVFRSVPRSMLTIFRCGFGDCSNEKGVPLAELIDAHYGTFYALGYCAFTFFVTIGFFNIVSAIFVDSTMAASAEQFLRQKQERLDNYNLWAKSAVGILKALLGASDVQPSSKSLATNLESIIHVEFEREAMDKALKTQTVKDALDALDIDPNDHGRLSDILDPDHSGTIGVLELVDGLRRLRGEPRRSDVVALDLMVRSLQDKTDLVLEGVLKSQVKLDQILFGSTTGIASMQELTSRQPASHEYQDELVAAGAITDLDPRRRFVV